MFLLFFSANLLSMQFSRYTGGLKWIRTTTQFTMVAARRFSLLLLPCSLGCRLAASRTAGARLGPFTLIRRALAVSPAVLAAFLGRLVGSSGFEPPTSRLSGVRSNRLSYKPRLLSKCADIWGYARGACTPEHKSLWMHMRRSRGMTGRRPGIPALANFKCWRSRLLLVLS